MARTKRTARQQVGGKVIAPKRPTRGVTIAAQEYAVKQANAKYGVFVCGKQAHGKWRPEQVIVYRPGHDKRAANAWAKHTGRVSAPRVAVKAVCVHVPAGRSVLAAVRDLLPELGLEEWVGDELWRERVFVCAAIPDGPVVRGECFTLGL